jgi:hypothetical protein
MSLKTGDMIVDGAAAVLHSAVVMMKKKTDYLTTVWILTKSRSSGAFNWNVAGSERKKIYRASI